MPTPKKSIVSHEQNLLKQKFRPGPLRDLFEEVSDGTISDSLKLTAAEIAWVRIVDLARSGPPNIALPASQYIIDRAYGKAAPRAEGDEDGRAFTVVIK